MRALLKTMVIVGALAAMPALAAADQPANVPPENQGTAHKGTAGSGGPEYNPTPPPQAKAYGVYCKAQGFSKKHVKGEKGTPFSRCVTAMARAAHNEDLSPGQICKIQKFSKKHVKGEKGTPFSRCVKAAAQLREDLQPVA